MEEEAPLSISQCSSCVISVSKDSPSELRADLNSGWVTRDLEMGSHLAKHQKHLWFPVATRISQGCGVWPHILWEQAAHLQQGQKYCRSSPRLAIPALSLPVLFRAPEVQGMCEHVKLMKNKVKHFRTCKTVQFQKWAKVWEEPYFFGEVYSSSIDIKISLSKNTNIWGIWQHTDSGNLSLFIPCNYTCLYMSVLFIIEPNMVFCEIPIID